MNLIKKLNLNKILIISGIAGLCFVLAFFVWWGTDISIINTNGDELTIIKDKIPPSLLTGTGCENTHTRPIAVMLASDPITRPLSGISQADITFEMPVTPGGVTRMMAVYQCTEPEDIGSVRSSREDFIPLAAGIGAIYAHWGGEREALKKLNSHVIDNIDALIYENKYFYRKAGIKQPHDGFTSFKMLKQAVGDLKYNMNLSFQGYSHKENTSNKNIVNIIDTILINYTAPYNITWTYNKDTNLYKRVRGGTPEIDRNNGQQSAVSVVAVVETTSKYISKDYININTVGEGDLEIYQNGMKISGKWKKDPSKLDSKLFFYDIGGKEIELAPGKIWVEIVLAN